MKLTVVIAQLAAALFMLLLLASWLGGDGHLVALAIVGCLIVLPVVATLEALGVFASLLRWLGWR